MKFIIVFFIIALSQTGWAKEYNLNGEAYAEPIPAWLQLKTNINSDTRCEEYVGNLAADLHEIRNAIGHAGNDIFFNASVGSEYTKEFNEAEIRLSGAYRALDALFLKAMDCNSTSGHIKTGN